MAVSSMFYRMKQNAVGLASICILSTMVLVMVSTTFSLYFGVQNALDVRFPSDIAIQLHNPLVGEGDHLKDLVTSYLENNDIQVEELVSYTEFPMMLVNEGNRFSFRDEGQSYEDMNATVAIMTYQDYFGITKDVVELKRNEVIIYSNVEDTNDSLVLINKEYDVKKRIDSIPFIDSNQYVTMKMVLLIVKDQVEFDSIYNYQKELFGESAYKQYDRIAMNLLGDNDEKIEVYNKLYTYTRNLSYEFENEVGQIQLRDSSNLDIYVESKQNNESTFYSMYGGFLFLGLFLGLLFIFLPS